MVEDNSINREVALAQLHILGHQADAASNGAEAIRAVQKKNYDLVLMDCEMPVMDGYEATRRIRISRRADIPVIALTAGAQRSDHERCLKVGMNDYLEKPVNLENLRRALEKWLPAAHPAQENVLQPGGTAGCESSEALPSSQILDTQELMAHLNGDIEFLRQLVSIFNATIPKRLDAIGEAVASGNAATLAKEAHAVKAAIRSFCCENATNAAANLEMLGQSGDLSQAEDSLEALEQAIADLTPELARLISR